MQKNPSAKNVFYKNALEIVGFTCSLSGAVFSLLGMCEFFTGNKVSSLLSDYQNNIPELLYNTIEQIDAPHLLTKTTIGTWILLAGMKISDYAKKAKFNH
ncbi:MAG: hypothetical protein BGO31_16830 [Bacteroidetes bacterium 43-16]|uniref:hypothetical protein n=1 Tax=uncultured Flavobacterium sp. TaxID=165435 RepID=UPI0009267EFB|nr:hypothetical protein [uncultured Flavobacterium sp.]OJV55759.1 MAG: hypothetical protein BGO31_16830 [Bacteroidetes bacterium 43-16]